ncbi:glucose-1-phosphate cytidylyltransferase [Leptospira bandrabouensis]|uniref:Glucose-1-phosphate cytidylyltransferase n=1 Tax=Leptospira bandrabouensis TaxID=2484903 RepID=A0A6H3NT77_9LEPT|nr:glucose-1-phosphate cytidylyltransferase [Leptospira bandrabouensis]MCG6144933.1 glucose-1-phosphate cytidylyltransferase [Leptospira bandrabouensis]MCG6152948.1 glucose-1-phosphate cytidylyltransferase [Leptospira bandrabouensis]MCG6160430.1 glucose-1-phosphate cytidylyltransferase [Leptospira bandrabouensis]MCG6164362.1 glucose-1-phosphate cytidylyltransferase [Leptospira bandrabouensis]MCW7460343.1 glucose-1-phosphate cytidylyltransferase [Leptospira bandrabouensis]
MKVIILAGGFGTRLSEYTDVIPKPMVPIGGKPILWHIMNHFARFNHNDFYIALGYKAEVVKEYFLNYRSLNSDFTVNLETGKITHYNSPKVDWNVTLVNTGANTMTGGRLLRMKEIIGNETFLLTYGDGLSNVDIDKLIQFHKSHKKMITVTAVHPGARFGELEIETGRVISFQEKPQTTQGWINGGFFVIEPSFFDLLENDQTILEKSPLETASKNGELMAYQHEGFWQCMDTKRDKDHLEELFQSGRAPWLN